MKRIITIVIICTLAQLAFSQNFGIGQPSPTEKLDVNGFIKTSQGIKFPDGTTQTTAGVGVANFFGYLANASSIVSANSGYARFSQVQNSDAAIFEVVSSGSFGIRIKKAGTIMWNYDQDIILNGGNYSYVRANAGGSGIAYSIIAPSNGKWDGMHNGGSYSVGANQVLTFLWGSSVSDIVAMDNGVWGHLSILWVGAK